ncbi:MAG: 50S ribosome-binding GTPase [Methylococcales bacterium]|nr:50S ribosome-binding GTPase [Methylococcales bacterium]
MDYDYSELVRKAQKWSQQTLDSGWVSPVEVQALSEAELNNADALFSNAGQRPLIVAFLGGTGVGKSTLINRLAGKDIARTGVERPTSREVTLFYHQSVALQQFPEHLPIEKIRTAPHQDDTHKDVMWVDMPDMDSTEMENKALVLEWLAHVDVLVYVVSPERYRDNKAWQLLLAEGGKHAWLFVMNQFDRGQPEQQVDFVQQLHKAGFVDPIIINTICAGENSNSEKDEFNRLGVTIHQLANRQTIAKIEYRSLQIKRADLKQRLEVCLARFGMDDAHQKLVDNWLLNWQRNEEILQKGMVWPLQCMSADYAEKETHLLEGLFRRKTEKQEPKKSVKTEFWDDWAQSRYEDELDQLILIADDQRLALAPLRQELQSLRVTAKSKVEAHVELAVRGALVRPGNGVQRFFLKLFAFLGAVLPLSAMGWVGYQVFEGYYQSGITERSYLGTDFAIHSILLILITWLLPFFIQRQLKPSMEKVALKGLATGLTKGLTALSADVLKVVAENKETRDHIVAEVQALIQQCESAGAKPQEVENSTLSRMLISDRK